MCSGERLFVRRRGAERKKRSQTERTNTFPSRAAGNGRIEPDTEGMGRIKPQKKWENGSHKNLKKGSFRHQTLFISFGYTKITPEGKGGPQRRQSAADTPDRENSAVSLPDGTARRAWALLLAQKRPAKTGAVQQNGL